jgi:hypothetical protein
MALPSKSDSGAIGVLLLFFAAVSYAAAEFAASQGFYRHGIEEALAVCSVAFLCAGMFAFLLNGAGSPKTDGTDFLIPTIGAIASLWIWHRFGLSYAFLAAMIFIPWLTVCWTSSHMAQHLIVAAFYSAGLIAVAILRFPHRFTYLDERYSIAEAFLWLGIYLACNLQLSSIDLLRQSLGGPASTAEFPNAFYWTTWVLTWCIPPAVLYRGLRWKDRFVIAAGGVAAVLTLVTNKPYLGWQRHTWDPMLLGALLIAIALFLNRWLSARPDGIRYGFTAKRLSGKDKRWMNAASVALGLSAQHATTPPPQADPGVHFGGGDSGGGGATSDF